MVYLLTCSWTVGFMTFWFRFVELCSLAALVSIVVCWSAVELNHSRTEHDAMNRQAESTNREYDRLLKEHSSLQVISHHSSLRAYPIHCFVKT